MESGGKKYSQQNDKERPDIKKSQEITVYHEGRGIIVQCGRRKRKGESKGGTVTWGGAKGEQRPQARTQIVGFAGRTGEARYREGLYCETHSRRSAFKRFGVSKFI